MNLPSTSAPPLNTVFTPRERRAALSLASLFALRMLGLFLILPVFAVHAPKLRGGDDIVLVGWALGIYGLTQGLLQIPFGMASDRYGRKSVIVFGLAVFALGSFVAAIADNIWLAIIGRALQGAGAISAAVTAYLADLTRDVVRSKAMALIGGSIGGMFALSLVGAPLLYAWIGMGGIFAFVGLLATLAIGVVKYIVPVEPLPAWLLQEYAKNAPKQAGFKLAFAPELVRLNVGIFVLHLVQMALFVVVPRLLIDVGDLRLADHWKVYLPVVLGSFALMMLPIQWGERTGHSKHVLLGAIGLLALTLVGFTLLNQSFIAIVLLLFTFFVGFNILEASLPSLVSKLAPREARGAALGVYNTTQALGLFAGGALGGTLLKYTEATGVFALGATLLVVWLLVAAHMQPIERIASSEKIGTGI